MSLFKRAMLYITRKRGRTILMLIIFIVIATLALTGLSVSKGADAAAAELRSGLGGFLKMDIDTKTNEPRFMNKEKAEAVAGIDGIIGYNGTNIDYLTVPELTLYPAKFTSEMDAKAQMARFLSVTNSEFHEYFASDTFLLKEGRHIKEGDTHKAVISEWIAETNGLKIGDSISATITHDSLIGADINTGGDFVYEVVGIFNVKNFDKPTDKTPECDVTNNFIFTDETSGNEVYSFMTDAQRKVYQYGATFHTDDPRLLPELAVKAAEEADLTGISVTINDKAYRTSAEPLERLSGFIEIFIMIVLIVSVALLSLILTMWMRDRVVESGIYMSIGIRRIEIFLQHVLENVLIAIIAFLLAWGLSAAIAVPASQMAETQTPEAQTEERFEGNTLYTDPVNIDYEYEGESTIEVSVGFLEWATIAGLGIVIIIVSVGVSSIAILRMKPRDILTQGQ